MRTVRYEVAEVGKELVDDQKKFGFLFPIESEATERFS